MSLVSTADDSIRVSQLDAAIRALAPAAMANICISAQARDLLLALLAAQRRALLKYEDGDPDPRGSHTLVSARALLTLARNADDAAIYEHIDAYADSSALLDNLLRSLSAAAEETPERAATARRIWPNVVRYVLQLNQSGRTPFRELTTETGRSAHSSPTLLANFPTSTARSMEVRSNGGTRLSWNPRSRRGWYAQRVMGRVPTG